MDYTKEQKRNQLRQELADIESRRQQILQEIAQFEKKPTRNFKDNIESVVPLQS
jgi:ElaB/YqjD/DUF883 family membrane-anchored ribosome-binding protein